MDTIFQRISILGLGLIGGSWGLSLSKHGFQGKRVGFDRTEVTRRALALGAIDETAASWEDAVREADLIILATPVGSILDLLPKLQGRVSSGALITDVGSTKEVIYRRAREIFGKNPLFLGGHPMTGKERSGLENAEAGLLTGARYVLTPLAPEHLDDPRFKAFRELLETLEARPIISDAEAHDRSAAYLSHLPQLLSSGLASLIEEEAIGKHLPLEMAAAGFRDMTRLAESPYSVWRDICLTNRKNIQAALDALIQKLEILKLHLSDLELEGEFKKALQLRQKLRDLG